MSKTPFTINIEHDDVAITTATMYGMRYPNGIIQWVSDKGGYGFGTIDFQKLAERDGYRMELWGKVLDGRAEDAKVDRDTYGAGHQLVKRSITIAITAPEVV